MAISPPTDLIMDVARAADPQRAQEAARKLASYTGAPTGDFAALVATPGSKTSSVTSFGWRGPISPRALDVAPRAHPKIASTGDAVTDAYRALGALLIQKMVEGALPSKTGAFGKGIAGDAWKSMLAEQVAKHAAAAAFQTTRHARDNAWTDTASAT